MNSHQPVLISSKSRNRIRSGGHAGYAVRIRTLNEIDDRFEDAWNDLERHASHRNPFASAAYTLAAARNLSKLAPPLILTVEQGGDIQGLGVFQSVLGSRRLPLKHLRSWQTPHTYFDAPLLRTGHEARVMEEFWNYFLHGFHEWHGVEFPRFPNHEDISRLFDETSRDSDISCRRGSCWERASLSTENEPESAVMQHLSCKRAKSLRRGWRELEKQGPVRFEFQTDSREISACTDEFIALENLGWKSDNGTSIGSQDAREKFFREMVAGMSEQGNVYYTRILAGQRPVISVVHLLAGETAYAFKLGWDPEFERGCPGFQIKLQTAVHVANRFPGVRLIDSCSSPGSFIEHVWPHRRSLCTRTYLTSPVAHWAATMVQSLRWVRRNAVAASRHLFQSDGELAQP